MSCTDSSAKIKHTERYRSGHNEAVLKTVCPQGRVGSNPTLSASWKISLLCRLVFYCQSIAISIDRSYLDQIRAEHGEVPKLAEGTPLERVQVVNSGAGGQIPPSPFWFCKKRQHEKFSKNWKNMLTNVKPRDNINKLSRTTEKKVERAQRK